MNQTNFKKKRRNYSQSMTDIKSEIKIHIMKKSVVLLFILPLFIACGNKSNQNDKSFISHKNGKFFLAENPYYFIGTNYWYGPILASEGQGGNRERLLNELDMMKQKGITNLRVLVGADGASGLDVKIRPSLQVEPGVYNDTIFDGLDFFMSELSKRDMHAVLYINNSWEWSGGYEQYLLWAGHEAMDEELRTNWSYLANYLAQYADCEACHQMFYKHIEHVIKRTNRYTGIKYSDDPAIMAWQVGNEPRAFSKTAKPAFASWIRKATDLIRSLDSNHLISIGSEGIIGSELDADLFEEIHAYPNVDYLTAHIWPANWNWVDKTKTDEDVETACEKSDKYIEQHLELAKKMNKALVIEEFGYPRDQYSFDTEALVTARDKYYESVLKQVLSSYKEQGHIAGCNFWAWGGIGRPAHARWQPGDDYIGDPAHEPQGFYAVFDTDSTIDIVEKYARLLK